MYAVPVAPWTVMMFAVWLFDVVVPGAAKFRMGAHGAPGDVAVVQTLSLVLQPVRSEASR